MSNRRGFLLGLGAALAAPAVVRSETLMKIAVLRESLTSKPLIKTFTRMMQQAAIHREVWEWREYTLLGSTVSRIEITSDGIRREPIREELYHV